MPVEIETPRFGPLALAEDEVWAFTRGVIGLPECCRFARLPFDDAAMPFEWLQCLDDVGVAFLLADPQRFFPDYRVVVPPEELAAIQLTAGASPEIRCIVTVGGAVADMTANLLGPVVLNRSERLGMQVVHADPQYATQHRLFPEAAAHAGSESPA